MKKAERLDRSLHLSGQFKQLLFLDRPKNFRTVASTGFEPMTSVMPMQCWCNAGAMLVQCRCNALPTEL